MSRTESDSNVLLGLMAVQLDFIDEPALLGALETWSSAKKKPLGEILVERKLLSAERRQTLEKMVRDHVRVHDGDTHRSLSAISVRDELVAKLKSLGDADVQDSVGQLTLASLGDRANPYATHQSSPGHGTIQSSQSSDRAKPVDDLPTQFTPPSRKAAGVGAGEHGPSPAVEDVGHATVRPASDATRVTTAAARAKPAATDTDSTGPATVITPPVAGPDRRIAPPPVTAASSSAGLASTAGSGLASSVSSSADAYGTHFTPPAEAKDRTLATTPGSGPVAATPRQDDSGRRSAPPPPLRYRRVRFHARGGLGQVSVALDEELKREVALKELQAQHAEFQENCDRFVLEAEITGRLEHPGIVPVYGLGHYDDGRPYYAMRFIRGDNLKEAIEGFHNDPIEHDPGTRELEFRKLLGRFIDVCNAIEYAHSRGVLHRDLKPGNVMLGKYGETLVVDWGLAKTIEAPETSMRISEKPIEMSSLSGSTDTQQGSVVGTPAYMSPEQARGRLDLLGPASDIYSLGATMYHLLVGASPFTGRDVSDVLDRVERGVFAKPRTVNPHVPPALEAICLKAMANEIDQRYPSAAALAADIEAYLADEPVSAWTEPWRVRAMRWIRRHQAMVSGVSAAVVVAILGLTITVVLLGAANEQLDQARDKAEDNFQMARDAVEKFFTAVSEDTLLNQPGMQDLRERLLKQALAYHEKFIQDRGDDPAVKAEVGKSHFYVARIIELLETKEKALPAYAKAEKLQRELLKEKETYERLIALSTTLNAIGRNHHNAGQFDAAQKYYDEALSLRKKALELRKALPDTPENRAETQESVRLTASTQMNLGDLQTKRAARPEIVADAAARTKLFDAAREQMQAAQTTRQTIPAAQREPKLNRDLGKGHYNLSVLEDTAGKPDEALKQIEAAEKIFAALVATGENDPAAINKVDYLDSQRNLAVCYRFHADLLARADKLAASATQYDQALAVAKKLYDANPHVHDYRVTFAEMLLQIGDGALFTEDATDDTTAAELADDAVELMKPLAADFKIPRYQRDYAASLYLRAALIGSEKRDQSITDLEAARDILKPLAETSAGDADLLKKVADELEKLQAKPEPKE